MTRMAKPRPEAPAPAQGLSRMPSALPPAAIAAAAALCYGGTRILKLGFYHDDWGFLSRLGPSPGFFAGMAALAREEQSLLFRPLGIPLYSALYNLFDGAALPWHVALLAVNAAAAWSVYRLLLRFLAPPRLALTGALLFLAYPSKDATMYWPFVIVNSASLLAWLRGYLAQLDYVESGRPGSLALALSFLAVSLALYDQPFFLFPVWLITPALMSEGVPRRARVGFAAAGGLAALAVLYKLAVVPKVLGVAFNKPMILSAENVLKVYRHGVEACLSLEVGRILFLFGKLAFEHVAALAALAAVLPFLVLAWRREEWPRPGVRLAAAAGAALFVLGYLPVAVSDYVPQPLNHMNRINQVPVLGICLLLVAAVGRLRPAFDAALCLTASAALAAHVGFSLAWVESYRIQSVVRDTMLRHLEEWPKDSTLLVLLPRYYVIGKAPVFIAHWDIGGAARYWTKDRGRKADIMVPRMRVRDDGVVNRGVFIPYASLCGLNAIKAELSCRLSKKTFVFE